MNDLLSGSFEIRRGQGNGDVELGSYSRTSGELSLDMFFKKVQEFDKQFERLGKLLRRLQDAHEESKAVTKAPAMKDIKQRMEKDVDEVKKIAYHIKTRIEELDREAKEWLWRRNRYRQVKNSNHHCLKKKLKDKMDEFQRLREMIHQEYREVLERRVYTVTGTRADEETIDRLIETGDGEQIFQNAIKEQGRGQVLDTLAEIHERHEAARDVEKKILDLQQIYLDLAVLVDSQGDILNNIESQVSTAVDHVQQGNNALVKAKKAQKSTRKWMCIAIMILLAVVAIVLTSVLIPRTNKRGA